MMSNNKEEGVTLHGVVTDVSNSVIFVEIQNGETKFTVTAYPSGKLRKNSIHILIGDAVDVVVSPYDFSKGRVTYRHARK